MRIDSARIDGHLRGELAPLWLLFGDEPLLVEEAVDALRHAAVAQGYDERLGFTVEAGFDWNSLHDAGQSMSLFSTRRLLELRMPGGRPGDKGSAALVEFATSAPPDTLLVIVCGRLDGAIQKQKWFRTIEEGGGNIVQAREVRAEMLAGWLAQRLKSRGLLPDRDSIGLLQYYFEGNLLAAAQEIDRLRLTLGNDAGRDAGRQYAALRDAVSDNSRFSVFNFIDTCLDGDAPRALRMLDGLHAEDNSPALLIAMLAREARAQVQLAAALSAGGQRDALFRRHRVWSSRQRVVDSALRRHGYAGWRRLLRRVARLDRVMRGRAPAESASLWLDVERVSLAICGINNA